MPLMNARSVLLVAVVALLAGGAVLLVRGIDGRSRRAAVTADASTPATRTETHGAADSPLAPATRSIGAARASVDESRAEPVATPSAASPTRLHVHVSLALPQSFGTPVPNARVEIVDSANVDGRPGWTVMARGETNAAGVFSFEAPRMFQATVRAEATSAGRALFGTSATLVPRASDTRIDVLLMDEPRVAARVTVLDRDTLLPIAGADVRPSNGAEPTTTNAAGEFSVPSTSGDVVAWIGADGYFPVVWQSFDPRWPEQVQPARPGVRSGPKLVPHTNAPRPWSMFLHPSASLRGTVLDARGRSVAGVRVRARVRFGADPSYRAREVVTETDDHGRFVLAALPAGLALPLAWTASGETARADLETVELAPGETRIVTVRIRGHVELSGRVLDGRDELVRGGHIEVSVDGRSDKSPIRGDGTYYLPFAVAGNGWITVTRERETHERVEPQRVPISIPFDVAEWTSDVRLTPASSIAGLFVDAENRPISGVLSLLRESTAVDETIVRNEGGSFRFEAVATGAYTVWGIEAGGAQRNVRVQAHAGDQNVLVRLPAQGVLVGRVVDASGAAVSGASIAIEPRDGLVLGLASAPDGGFRAPAPIGTAWVSAEKGELHSFLERVAVGVEGESTVPDLVLAPSAPLRLMAGRFTQPAHVEVVSDAGLCFSGSLTSYADRKIRVPLGIVRVSVTCAGKPQRVRAIEVRAGEMAVVPILEGP